MKVYELIEKLEVLDEDLEVVIGNEGGEYNYIEGIRFVAITKDLDKDELVATLLGTEPYDEPT